METSHRLLALAALALFATASTPAHGEDASAKFSFGKSTISVQLPDGFRSTDEELGEIRVKTWRGQIAGVNVYIALQANDFTKKKMDSAQQMVELSVVPPGEERVIERLYGQFGLGGYGMMYSLHKDGNEATGLMRFVGLMDTHGFSMTFAFDPLLPKENRKLVEQIIREGVVVTTPFRYPKWSEEEVEERWTEFVPDPKIRKKRKRTVRTKHFVIIGTAKRAKKVAKRLEDTYEKCKQIFPHVDFGPYRLLPVFCFAKRSEFEAVFRAQEPGITKEALAATKGLSHLDYIAFDEKASEQVQVRLGVFQYFRSRLNLYHGRAWFKWGASALLYTDAGALTAHMKGLIKSKKQLSISELFALKKIDTTDKANAVEQVFQAASIVLYARATLKPAKFNEFVKRMGGAKAEDDSVQAEIIEDLFDTELEGFESSWASFFSQ